jgi:NADH:ubiquinone oxidoreductase subunit 6 (subunit J)
VQAVVARIKIPPEAIVPLLLISIAIGILLVFGAKLAEWKRKHPQSAERFGLVVAAVFTGLSVYFMLHGLTNQSDPNNRIVGVENINFTDAPIAGGMAALAAAFWRMASQRIVALLIGVGIGAVMLTKPFVWPVLSMHEGGSWPRGTMDPEHIMFLGPGLVAIIVGLIAGLKKPR